jgi:tetratricopeptide (TPR) repeat protein
MLHSYLPSWYLPSWLSLFFSFLFFQAFSQDSQAFSKGSADYVTDSLNKKLVEAQTPRDKVRCLISLAMVTIDKAKSKQLSEQALAVAQMSRDRLLIAQTYEMKGGLYLNNAGLADNLQRAEENFHQAEQLSRDNGLDEELVYSLCRLSDVWQYRRNNMKALSYSSQALSVAMNTESDSAKQRAYGSMGETYQSMDEMLLALRNYLSALDIAEKSGSDALLRDSYAYMDNFYEAIHDYDKAIDYRMKVFQLDRKTWNQRMTADEYRLGDLFTENKQPDLAMDMYERSIRLADTLHFPLLKFNSYFRIFSMYMHDNEYAKGMNYLQSHQEVVDILNGFGFGFYVQQIYGMAYGEQGKNDSALYYFRLAEPEVEKKSIPETQYDFYRAFGDFYIRRKDYPSAIDCYTRAFAKASGSGQLEWEAQSTDTLETLYQKAGDYKNALVCTMRSAAERDSLRTQGRATDLMKLEVENDSRRRERQAREELLRTEHRHNVQYMGLTVGLVTLFILLAMMGRLSVSVSVIRALGFLSFIFLFEFIILLADKPIQALTGDEPWKILLIKIALGAGLVPLHHWLEHKVIHYLSSHRRMGVPVAKKTAHAE